MTSAIQPPLPTDCPGWCVMHVGGDHTGELEHHTTVNGHGIYTRPVDCGDNKVGLEVVVVPVKGGDPIRIPIPPDEVMEAAMLSDLISSIAAFEGGAEFPDARGNA